MIVGRAQEPAAEKMSWRALLVAQWVGPCRQMELRPSRRAGIPQPQGRSLIRMTSNWGNKACPHPRVDKSGLVEDLDGRSVRIRKGRLRP